MDKRWGLWQQEKKEETAAADAPDAEDKEEAINKSTAEQEAEKKTEAVCGGDDDLMIGMGSCNPVLENITDYLIEEASAEEEELLGKNSELEDGEEGEEGNSVVRDEELLKSVVFSLFLLDTSDL